MDPDLKAVGPFYGPYPIGLLYFIGPSSKVALKNLSSPDAPRIEQD
jgi:hypothetical protein